MNVVRAGTSPVGGCVEAEFLSRIEGLIHVGANIGQERELYARHGLEVLWFEPNPDVYGRLVRNLEAFPKQHAFPYLVTDRDDEEYPFYLSNNDGRSSSIFDLNLHQELWPNVFYEGAISLRSVTLDTVLERHAVSKRLLGALVMDTQGSELLVLKGAARHLSEIRYVKTEAADFEAYSKGCTVEQLTEYLSGFGFEEIVREPFASRKAVGTYYDVTYANRRLV
ncbi:MAG: FkbM family methyltransferase [Polyangiaceae bacterium]